jgi:hypothetical protein
MVAGQSLPRVEAFPKAFSFGRVDLKWSETLDNLVEIIDIYRYLRMHSWYLKPKKYYFFQFGRKNGTVK